MKVMSSIFVFTLVVATFGFSSPSQQEGNSMFSNKLSYGMLSVKGGN